MREGGEGFLCLLLQGRTHCNVITEHVCKRELNNSEKGSRKSRMFWMAVVKKGLFQ